MAGTPPTYEELLRALQQIELRFQALEKAHTDLLEELQARIIKMQATLDASLPRSDAPK